MSNRISFSEKDLSFVLMSLGLKSFSKKIIKTQRGSVVIAEKNDMFFAIKISAKSSNLIILQGWIVSERDKRTIKSEF